MSWPPRRILVGVDFSESSRAALSAASGLARRVGATLSLLHVVPDALLFSPSPEARAAASRRLSLLAEREAPPGTDFHVRKGDPTLELVALRDLGDFDLVVTGAGHMRSMGRFVLGSVAGKLLGYPGAPLLIVASTPSGGEFKRILIAQENPRVTSPWQKIGLALAHAERGEVALLHVLPPRGYLSDRHHVDLEPQRAPSRLCAQLAKLDPTVPAQVVIRQGEAGNEIAVAARELDVHLVVLGAERNRPDHGPGPVVNRIARSGVPALLVIWPERESDEEFAEH
ncbi:MAG TPA: universal stress protein [Myxococcota bacterium]|nr:universal stress protein [Myxococcota bacterium]